MFCLGGCVGKLPPEHSTAHATGTDDTHSQLSSIQPPSTNGHAIDADSATREGSILADLAVSSRDIPASAFENEPSPRAPKREKSAASGMSHNSRSSSQSSIHVSNGQHMLRSNTQTSSSIGSLTGLLNNIRSLGQASTQGSQSGKAAIGGGQKQYPLSSRFYKMNRRIGEGASATVWRARCVLFDEDVAIKVINLDKEDIDVTLFVHEASAMAALNHPYIIPLYASFIEHNRLWMVQPFIDGGDLYEIMQKGFPKGLPDSWIAIIMRHCLEALQYIHAQGYVHRDIKGANVLIDHNGHIFIADFTIATQLERSFDASTVEMLKAEGFTGTIAWMAPEIVEGLGADAKSDIWSLGMTVVELACGRNPWLDQPFNRVMMSVVHGEPPALPEGPSISQNCRSFVERCLQKDPADRPSAAELLKHPFVKFVANERVLGDNLVPHIPTTHYSSKELHDPLVGRYYRRFRNNRETERATRAGSLVENTASKSAQELLGEDHHKVQSSNQAFIMRKQGGSLSKSTPNTARSKSHVRFADEASLSPAPSAVSNKSSQRSLSRMSTFSRMSSGLKSFGRLLSTRKSSRINFEWNFEPAMQAEAEAAAEEEARREATAATEGDVDVPAGQGGHDVAAGGLAVGDGGAHEGVDSPFEKAQGPAEEVPPPLQDKEPQVVHGSAAVVNGGT